MERLLMRRRGFINGDYRDQESGVNPKESWPGARTGKRRWARTASVTSQRHARRGELNCASTCVACARPPRLVPQKRVGRGNREPSLHWPVEEIAFAPS